jgi:hypothetical protein
VCACSSENAVLLSIDINSSSPGSSSSMRASVYLITVGSVTFFTSFNNAPASTLPESVASHTAH